MENKIALIGYGELGRQLQDFLSIDNKNRFIFFDDLLFDKGNDPHVFPFKDYSSPKFDDHEFYIGLGYHRLKEKAGIIDELLGLNRNLPLFIHPSSFINISANIGFGSFIYPMCNIDKMCRIGNGVLLNNSVCISHNSIVGDASYLSPGVIVSGNVEIGKRTFIGSGSVISNNVRIGNDVTIGVGTIVTKDIPDGYSAIGNPARLFEHKLNLI
jgi:sugar O-acyltransferase (sialic acid O-acetyltransferase NeuD family)